MSNICIYTHDPNILTQSKVNREFALIHKHLCYLESQSGGGLTQVTTSNTSTVTFSGLGTSGSPLTATASVLANDGLSVSSNTVKLGQVVGGSGASLTESREIPLNTFSLSFLTSAGFSLRVGQEGFSNNPSLHSTGTFNFFSDVNNYVFEGSGGGIDNYPVFQMVNGIGATVTRYSTVIGGYASGTRGDMLITTYSNGGAGGGAGGDIILRPSTNLTVQPHFVVASQVDPGNILLQPSAASYVQLTCVDGKPKMAIGAITPTAELHLAAGTATAGTAPLKLTSGVNLTTPEDGVLEYNGTHLFFTIGSSRIQLDLPLNKGTATFTADGTTTVFNIAHGLGSVPSNIQLTNLDPVTQNLLNRTITLNATNIVITFGTAPLVGENCLYNWVAYK